MQWLNEIKTPLMASRILGDLGHGNLEHRIETLHKVLERELSLGTAQTEEENFVKLATKSKLMH